ncbi:hypothetical protein [Flavobacterium sp. GT3R68]|uniref:hypothetical protein n=1 Tax=Flavobacterium sp. GT3R68 TaxID=2594437 RepID=UPI000F898ACB|nr:hypothetical protein [Flavobacterium sp. GT3R68]RTY95938.1 hypothetical protein EKL32_04645 [Flavobacterium sp. GSN2]TRW93710.1 hypothetical protein FNW07_02035 [Flavobacterium sp. GT3R68]
MGIKKFRPILEVLLLAIPIYIIHKIIFSFVKSIPHEAFHYSLEQVYGFFLMASLLIVLVLVIIREKNLDIVGYTFLLITSMKMGVSYFVLRPILLNANESQHSEKINFFIIFALFLAIETVITIRLLNNKQ